jgi:GT2 family glycosyltransferase
MSEPSTSVLIASTRPLALVCCLESLAAQTTPPGEVLVAWQGDDTATRDAAVETAARLRLPVRAVHSPERGVVLAENAALDAAGGEVVLLIDDDAVAPRDWLARHLARYADPKVGAVGGPFRNYYADGSPFAERAADPVGALSWYGKPHGNMNDHPAAWRDRPAAEVHHLAGGNMSLRRAAFGRFEGRLRRYWQFFEMDACLQVRARGYRVLFDFANVIDHHPTSTVFRAGRDGDLAVKVFHPAYNHAFVLGKHLAGWRRVACLAYLLGVGSVGAPGLLGSLVAAWRYGRPWRELGILRRTLRARVDGWRAGSRGRADRREAAGPPVLAADAPA